jgi:DNA-binding transcriptional regulator YdaS (Cro superfamily)
MICNLDIAIDHFGTKAALARALNIDPMVVYQWSKRGIPASRAVEIETASNGLVNRHELRPDLFKTDKAS